MSAPWLVLLGDAVRRARRRAGLTQAQLGEPVLTKSFVSQLEHGAVAPSVASLFHIADRLRIRPVQLVALADVRLRCDTLLALAEAALVLEGAGAADAWIAALDSLNCDADPTVLARRQRFAGLRCLAAGDPQAALEHLGRALALHEQGASGGGTQEALVTLYWLGTAQHLAGRPVAATRAWEQVVAGLGEPSAPPPEGHPVPFVAPAITACLCRVTWLRLAALYERMGDADASSRARDHAAQIAGAPRASEDSRTIARLLWLTALEAYHRADLPGAAACARLVPLLWTGPA